MTFASDPATVLPSLALLSHRVRVLPMDAASLVKMPENTILFLDARDDLATAKTLCRLIHASGLSTPIVLVLTEGGFTVVNSSGALRMWWSPPLPRPKSRADCDWSPSAATLPQPQQPVLPPNPPPRWKMARFAPATSLWTPTAIPPPCMDAPSIWHTRSSNSSSTWSSTPAACSRAPAAAGVWGYDYYGGTRTVDVHIRRLRAKLGGEYEHLIGTVRNVGYRFDPPETDKELPPHSRPPKHPLPPSTPMTILPISTPSPDRPAALQTINHRYYAA